MRVGIEIRRADPVESGQQRYLWRLGGWLAGRGEDVHLVTVQDVPPDALPPEGATLHRWRRLRRAELLRRVRELQLDILLLNPERSRPFRGIRANVLRPAYGTRHYEQKLRSFRTPLRSLARRALRLAPWEVLERRWERRFYEVREPPPEVIAVSEYMKGEVLRCYDVPPDRIHVVHNGVDLAEFSPERRADLRDAERTRWDLPDEAFCLLFMGHNFRLKGLWQLLEIVARIRTEEPDADLRLLVAGRGTGRIQRRRARRRVRRLGLDDAVRLAGAVHPAIRAFAAADAFVHLSWHDSFGFVTLEAMAAGLPVVTTPYVGASEIIADGESGILVDPRKPDAVVDGIRRLLRSDERVRIGEAAAAVGARHGEEENFRRVHDVFRTAADRAPGPVR